MMAWVRLDDRFHSHPKVQQAWQTDPISVGLYTLALTYAGAYLTDGQIPATVVAAWIPKRTQRNRAIGALVDAGLWAANGDGWEIHDYLDYNERRDVVIDRRQEREKRRRGNKQQWKSEARP